MFDIQAVRDEVIGSTHVPDSIFSDLLVEKLINKASSFKNTQSGVDELVDIVEICIRLAELRQINGGLFYSMLGEKALKEGKYTHNRVEIKKKEVFYE